MAVTSTAATASAVLGLSKSAWKLGISLSNLDQDANNVNLAIKSLAGEVKSLGNECDHLYIVLDEVASKSETGPSPAGDVDERIWNCLATQVEETNQTIKELGVFARSEEESNFIGQVRRWRKLDNDSDRIADISTKVCRHTDGLHTTLLLINT
jgi:hypothetical protein